jgi:hypothetical protein
MIWIGIDDTDTLDTPGTNQLARALAARLAGRYRLVRIVRHQLLFDERIPYTSHNGSASIVLESRHGHDRCAVIDELRAGMRAWLVPGSDPGLCVAHSVPAEVAAYGRLCQREIVDQALAREIAARHGLHLEGLGGTEGGVIGALAAIGLIATGDDGRVVQLGDWPDDLTGVQSVAAVEERGVEVRRLEDGGRVVSGRINVGKKMRPNVRGGGNVLFVTAAQFDAAADAPWQAVKLS